MEKLRRKWRWVRVSRRSRALSTSHVPPASVPEASAVAARTVLFVAATKASGFVMPTKLISGMACTRDGERIGRMALPAGG